MTDRAGEDDKQDLAQTWHSVSEGREYSILHMNVREKQREWGTDSLLSYLLQ